MIAALSRWSVLPLLVLSLGCPQSRGYRGPINVPGMWPAAHEDEVLQSGVYVLWGARPPIPVRELRASCEDERVCRAVVRAGERYPELLVFGTGPGVTLVTLHYVHPGLETPQEHRVAVTFLPPVVSAYLRAGADLPSDRLPARLEVEGQEAVCRRIYGGGLKSGIPGTARSDVPVFECELDWLEHEGLRRRRRCQTACLAKARFSACLTLAGQRIASVTAYTHVTDRGVFQGFRQVAHTGAPAPECALPK